MHMAQHHHQQIPHAASIPYTPLPFMLQLQPQVTIKAHACTAC